MNVSLRQGNRRRMDSNDDEVMKMCAAHEAASPTVNVGVTEINSGTGVLIYSPL